VVRRIDGPKRIPVPGGKIIDEHVGRVSTGDQHVSIAHMIAPPGWGEPAQTPEFAEYTVVLRGTLWVRHGSVSVEVGAGQAVICEPGEQVRYSTGDEETEYIAVCLPAFAPDLAVREE
jgi:mannose-6-phosphate isomerase-like protein (cupin superfamily)